MLGLVILTPPGRREIVQRVHGRTMTNDEGIKLLRMVRRSSGSVATWRRTQMVLLSAQGMEPTAIAEVTFTSADRVRDVIHNFSSDGFAYLAPKYGGGRPPKFTLPQRQGRQEDCTRPGVSAQFTALRYFALDGTDHNSHTGQASMIRRYVAWRTRYAASHPKLRKIITKAATIRRAKVA